MRLRNAGIRDGRWHSRHEWRGTGPSVFLGVLVQATGQRAFRVDLANGLLGMAAATGALAALMTSLRLGSGFLPAMWAFAALVGIPAYGRVSRRSAPRLPTNAPEQWHAAFTSSSPVLYGSCTLVGLVCGLGRLRVSSKTWTSDTGMMDLTTFSSRSSIHVRDACVRSWAEKCCRKRGAENEESSSFSILLFLSPMRNARN